MTAAQGPGESEYVLRTSPTGSAASARSAIAGTPPAHASSGQANVDATDTVGLGERIRRIHPDGLARIARDGDEEADTGPELRIRRHAQRRVTGPQLGRIGKSSGAESHRLPESADAPASFESAHEQSRPMTVAACTPRATSCTPSTVSSPSTTRSPGIS